MKRLKKQRETEFIAIMEEIKAYAKKYGESHLSFSYSDDLVNAFNSIFEQDKHYMYSMFNNGRIVFSDAYDTYEVIRKGNTE